MTGRVALGLVVIVALGVVSAADESPTPVDATPVGRELDAIREQVVALEIEAALAAVDAILERPALPEATRVGALDLRAQAYVASDDLDAAEKDYRAILELRAGYAPGREVTSKKAMDRFLRLQASMIGTVHLDVSPKDASLTVDDRPVSVLADGAFQAVSGERRLRVMRKGFDPQDVVVDAVAGQETLVGIRLVPNSRSLVVRTDVDGVAVALDGIAAGVTALDGNSGSDENAPAALVIEDVAIGEHGLRLAKPCFATESLDEIVSVDLADVSPKLLRVVAMRPSSTTVTVTGALYDGELRVDGDRVAALPLTSFAMCPGFRTLEVVASGRIVWSGAFTAEESDLMLDLSPRPSVVLVGTAWPKAWVAAAAAWSVLERIDPPSGADLTAREGWTAVAVPPGTDLAVAVLPGSGLAGDEHILLYSPALHEVEARVSPPPSSAPPWAVATLGVILVDGVAGSVVLTSVSPKGPAALAGLLPGDRLVAIAGRAVTTAASAKDAVVASGIRATVLLDVVGPSGTARRVECVTSAEPSIVPAIRDDGSRVMRAAWASVGAAAGGPDSALPLANLAILLERSGRGAVALDAWRQVRSAGGGVLAARAAYAVGAALQAAGKAAEAIDAFVQANAEGMLNGDKALAAAATDRLADLGVAPR